MLIKYLIKVGLHVIHSSFDPFNLLTSSRNFRKLIRKGRNGKVSAFLNICIDFLHRVFTNGRWLPTSHFIMNISISLYAITNSLTNIIFFINFNKLPLNFGYLHVFCTQENDDCLYFTLCEFTIYWDILYKCGSSVSNQTP